MHGDLTIKQYMNDQKTRLVLCTATSRSILSREGSCSSPTSTTRAYPAEEFFCTEEYKHEPQSMALLTGKRVSGIRYTKKEAQDAVAGVRCLR